MFKWLRKKKPVSAPTQLEKNEMVRSQLKQHGDMGGASRHVIHFAYPVGKSEVMKKDEVTAYLKSLDMTVTEAASDDGLKAEHVSEVASDSFDDLTNAISARLSAMGWEYDSWECALVN